MDYDSESNLISLLTEFISPEYRVRPTKFSKLNHHNKFLKLHSIHKVIALLRSMDWNSQPKPESEFMSLTSQIISFFSTLDLDSQPKPLSELISFFHRQSLMDCEISNRAVRSSELDLFLDQTLDLNPEPKLISLIHQILSLVLSMTSLREKLVSLCPQACVTLEKGKFHVHEEEEALYLRSTKKWECFSINWRRSNLAREKDVTYFHCLNCNGENHKEYTKAPVEIKHTLHRKHSLHLVLCKSTTRKCYCCDEDLENMFYYCSACDLAINFACAEKQPVLSLDHPKMHEHTLTLFPRRSLLTCDVCALTHSNYPFYTCPPCDFVIHQSCLSLPRVIRISRHLHRIKFTHSFGVGDRVCGVCRKKINNNYGGYCCIKEDCSYGAHSKCATQSNVWDGEELEGIPEEVEEEIEPFVKISHGIIQHFLHQHHHLKLDENTSKDYDDNRHCHACVMPIYFGNFYSCLQCDFILHEQCANLSRKIYHPIHQHMLTLVGGYDDILDYHSDRCSTCSQVCKTGFFYKCCKDGCRFQLEVQCAMISEPLVHESHLHPLYLTSKPGDKKRNCSICKDSRETFNCIECNFSLCFSCATLPHKVRYKYDKHTLTLSYRNEITTMMFWCELCEKKINPTERFYMCDEYCSVTLHIQCMLGSYLYMKPGSLWVYAYRKIGALPNNQMSRPICSRCKIRCRDKIVFRVFGTMICSIDCALKGFTRQELDTSEQSPEIECATQREYQTRSIAKTERGF